MYWVADVARGLKPSILPQRDLNSRSVRSDVQQIAEAGVEPLAGLKGEEHFAARGVPRMLVVVCKSHLDDVSIGTGRACWHLLVMSAYKLLVLGECNIALDATSPLTSSSVVRLGGVLWVLQWCSTVAEGELADLVAIF